MNITRRNWIWLASASVAVAADESYPRQPAALAREMVGASHVNVKRVKELLAQRPALVNASWDWGFGDWETALGAASHVGNKEIAELLLAGGAAPTMFSAAMLGQTAVLKAMIAARPGVGVNALLSRKRYAMRRLRDRLRDLYEELSER